MDTETIWEKVRRPNDQWMTHQNIVDLCDFARKVPDRGIIVDIGIGGATSACAMSFAAQENVRVYTIGPDITDIPRNVVHDLDRGAYVLFVQGESSKVFPHWIIPPDLVFVDGMHTYEAVSADAREWGSILKSGGYLIFHDYDLYSNTIGKAIDDFYEENKDKFVEAIRSENLKGFRKL